MNQAVLLGAVQTALYSSLNAQKKNILFQKDRRPFHNLDTTMRAICPIILPVAQGHIYRQICAQISPLPLATSQTTSQTEYIWLQ
jgi:hypothetical protein